MREANFQVELAQWEAAKVEHKKLMHKRKAKQVEAAKAAWKAARTSAETAAPSPAALAPHVCTAVTDRRCKHQARIELRLQPQLDTPSPLGRGSSHAPNKPVCLLSSGTVVAFLLQVVLRSGH